jgi:hypothetical protein
MLGSHLDAWDYATFAALAVVFISLLVFLVWLAGLPGRIAIARKHPDAETGGRVRRQPAGPAGHGRRHRARRRHRVLRL